MFQKKREIIGGREAIVVSGLGSYLLTDTFECGQCFRHVRLHPSENSKNSLASLCEGYVEYMTVVEDAIIFVGQRTVGELLFFDMSDECFERLAVPYFALDTDYRVIKESIIENAKSEFLKTAANEAEGIRILRQMPWETLFSFIVSQNNNIPRIKKIIRTVALAYGENLAKKHGLSECPIACGEGRRCAGEGTPSSKLDSSMCDQCGACYSFPTARMVADAPELLLPSHPGFRYKYLIDAAERVSTGTTNLQDILDKHSYQYTLSELMKIKGVGEKVASCTSLFAFSNLEAFPIDVWMRRAIDEYFGGDLDPKTLGPYAGVAQQYIFHYIRLLSGK